MVVNVSRLFSAKGTAELIHAVALVKDEVPDVRLVIVGRDTSGTGFMAQLEQIVEDEVLDDHVRFVGQRSDVVRYMVAADIFAMPSSESSSGSCTRRPWQWRSVVALNNGGTLEVVDDARLGCCQTRATSRHWRTTS